MKPDTQAVFPGDTFADLAGRMRGLADRLDDISERCAARASKYGHPGALEDLTDEKAARLDLSLLAADECARADLMRDLLTRARWFVNDALEAHEHSDGRELLTEIDQALQAKDPNP